MSAQSSQPQLSTLQPHFDLAGPVYRNPGYSQIRDRLNYLIEQYLSPEILNQNLNDLPQQFTQPKPRPWGSIDWKAIRPDQIIGIDPQLFLCVVASSVEIEAPIRAYSLISRQYLAEIHPAITHFLSGCYDSEGQLIEMGVWEKEERQHAPAFRKIYQQLAGEDSSPTPNSIIELPSSGSVVKDAYRHSLRRITTEWSAVAVYLWLMAHSTGALQAAIAQPLQDEVNHLAKFWGISRWGFQDALPQRCAGMTRQFAHLFGHHRDDRSNSRSVFTLRNLSYGPELGFSYLRILNQLCHWHMTLNNTLLYDLFGPRPFLQPSLSSNSHSPSC